MSDVEDETHLAHSPSFSGWLDKAVVTKAARWASTARTSIGRAPRPAEWAVQATARAFASLGANSTLTFVLAGPRGRQGVSGVPTEAGFDAFVTQVRGAVLRVSDRALRSLQAGVAIAGTEISAYLSAERAAGRTPACPIGGGCETVQSSRYAEVGGSRWRGSAWRATRRSSLPRSGPAPRVGCSDSSRRPSVLGSPPG
jgi:hypothetical protein